ncbi:MAG: DUF692 family protein [Alphaproteobacteria bacterium]|nr:DUF692 family protein [Alphaproteobacteria bacterium]
MSGGAYPFLGFGAGLRAPHYEDVIARRPALDWFEIISENFLDAHEGYWQMLADLRADYPFVMHGVSLSIGGPDPLDEAYLAKLKDLAAFLSPAWVSDHLCFTGLGGHNTHDLLPLPYTEKALSHIAARVHKAQESLGRPLVLENPSSYFEYAASDIPEWEFLRALAQRTGCGLLLDVNNVYVSAFNHGYDARAYIDAMPAGQIAQMHLAGHLNKGTHIIDTHDAHVIDAVWDLYAYAVQQKGLVSSMVEWDEQIPPLAVLLEEVGKARRHAQAAQTAKEAGHAIPQCA